MWITYLTCALLIGILPNHLDASVFKKHHKRDLDLLSRARDHLSTGSNYFRDAAAKVKDAIPFLRSQEEPQCNGVTESCGESFHNLELYNPPGLKEMLTVCPKYLAFTRCAIEYSIRCHKSEPLRKEMFEGHLSVWGDICNPLSELGRRYAANVQCIKNMQSNGIIFDDSCRNDADKLARLFRNSTLVSEHDIGTPLSEDCVKLAHDVTCQATTAKSDCGDEAFYLLLDIAEKSKAFEAVCSPAYREDE